MAGPIEPVQYIIMDPKQRMSTGKRCAQAAHASVEGVILSAERDVDRWRLGGHYTKIVLMGDVPAAHAYLIARDIRCALIIDEGRTEFDGELTLTAVGSAIVNKNDPHIAATFSTFKLYNEPPQYIVLEYDGRVSAEEYQKIKELCRAGKIAEAQVLLRQPQTRPWWKSLFREGGQ